MKYEYDYSALRGRIVTVYGTLSAFAESIGKSLANVSLHLKGKGIFDQDTILLWAESLQIGNEDIPTFFYVRKVDS